MQPLIKALAWSFVHSLWQGLFAALLAAIIISATRKTKASLRYNLLGMLFVFFLAAVSVTFIIHLRALSVSSWAGISQGYGTGNSNANNAVITLPGGFMADLTAWFDNNTGLLLALWTLFFLVNCLKLVRGLAAINRLRHYKVYPVTEEWKIKLEQLRYSLGIRQSICLLQSELVKVPVALGFLKPVILLPVGLLSNIPFEQVEAILLHELGHIRRKDYLVNFVQHFAEAIFFFNPALLWISSLLRQEREACCDDIVVTKTGQKRNYLNALVSFQEYYLTHKSYAMSFSSRRQYLLNRVKRIVTNENKKLNIFEKAALLSGILLFSAFTYITNKKETVGGSFSIATEQFTTLQVPIVHFITTPLGKQSTELPTGENNRTSRIDKSLTDTVPAKKDKIAQAVPDTNHNKLPTIKDWETAKILQDIQQIKDKIGVKKESIGVKKELLAKLKDAREEKALRDQIEKERDEVEAQRDILEKMREQLNELRKQKEKHDGTKHEQKNELKHEKNNEGGPGKGSGMGIGMGSGMGSGAGNGTGKGQGDKVSGGRTDDKSIQIKPRTDFKLEEIKYMPGQTKLEYQPGQTGKLEYIPVKKSQFEDEPCPPIKLNTPPSPDFKKNPKAPLPAKQVKL